MPLLRSSAVVLIKTQHGLGDNFYAYPVVRALARRLLSREPEGTTVAIKTPWPQLYEEAPELSPIACGSKLRTQAENMLRFADLPSTSGRVDVMNIDYSGELEMIRERSATLFELVEFHALVEHTEFFFPVPESWIGRARKWLMAKGIDPDRPFFIAQYPIRRTEWNCTARLPMPGLVPEMVRAVAGELPVLSIGHADPPREWFAERDRPATHRAEDGSMPIECLIAATQLAAGVIAPVGFLVPMTLATGGRLLVCFGGHMAPEVVIDKRMTTQTERCPQRHVTVIAPDPCCNCVDNNHRCEKDVDMGEARHHARSFRKELEDNEWLT